ncbi:hypothetical protein D6C85_08201 [Aureobasidium pullulans]|uniref:Uncharacterized protein n=1 Tax=Aureobasidium pullulans TaxID=5580 RepID=A0A4S9WKZ2_AURPU|nr:hypothetical protein D6C85_08201 [Aureobasidium pullulans]
MVLSSKSSKIITKMAAPSISPMESTTSSSSTNSHKTSTSSLNPHLEGGYDYVFPAHKKTTTSNTQGLSENTKSLYKQLLHQKPLMPALSDDHTVLFSNGLQWLLDTATETERAAADRKRREKRMGAPLTEDAVRALDSNPRIKDLGDLDSVSAASVDRARIDAWVTEMDAAP